MPEYCFVVGCARSGTTALARLVHAHPQVVIGLERYKHLVTGGRDDEFGPQLFEPERFLDFRPDDTNIRPEPERFRPHYEMATERLLHGDVRIIGDKVMARQHGIELICSKFERARVVFIYRDPLRVASSFTARARDPKDAWPTVGTHELALERWHEAFDMMAPLLSEDRRGDTFVVRYERLLCGDERVCAALFSFLGLEVLPPVERHFRKATARWEEFDQKPLELDETGRAYVEAHVDLDRLRRFDREFERDLARYTAT